MTPQKLDIPASILCVAAVKYASAEQINLLIKEGILDIGWSTVQQMKKISSSLPTCRHHFIGHLQRNKVRQLLEQPIELIHSVDSWELLKKIESEAAYIGVTQRVLLQVRTDPAKEYGLLYSEIENTLPIIGGELRHIRVEGFMTIPPEGGEPEASRHIFNELRLFRDELEKKYHLSLPHLSMGMSGDYKIAIEEGATIVRLGRILFQVI